MLYNVVEVNFTFAFSFLSVTFILFKLSCHNELSDPEIKNYKQSQMSFFLLVAYTKYQI